MVTEFVLYVVLINAQRSLPVITKGVEVSFDLFFFFFSWIFQSGWTEAW